MKSRYLGKIPSLVYLMFNCYTPLKKTSVGTWSPSFLSTNEEKHKNHRMKLRKLAKITKAEQAKDSFKFKAPKGVPPRALKKIRGYKYLVKTGKIKVKGTKTKQASNPKPKAEQRVSYLGDFEGSSWWPVTQVTPFENPCRGEPLRSIWTKTDANTCCVLERRGRQL